ncbi:hypothetical protein IOD13_18180 [Brevibacterium casei]|nr:hypothetical protein [Brevibacterium casei]
MRRIGGPGGLAFGDEEEDLVAGIRPRVGRLGDEGRRSGHPRAIVFAMATATFAANAMMTVTQPAARRLVRLGVDSARTLGHGSVLPVAGR